MWLILVVPLLATLCRWLIHTNSFRLDVMLYPATTFPLAWTCVWLSAPYLSRQTKARAFASTMAVLVGAGLIAYLGYCGLWWSTETGLLAVPFWIVPSIGLVSASLLAGHFCRRQLRVGRFGLALLLLLPVVTALVMVVGMCGVYIVLTGNPMIAITMVFIAGMLSLIVSGILLVMNLPVLVLAAKTDCYRRRLENLFCPTSATPAAPASPAGGNPFSESADSP